MNDINMNSSYNLRIDDIIFKLMNSTITNPVKLTSDECIALSFVSKSIFEKESMMLDLTAPINICGDIHGQFRDLLRLFDLCGQIPKNRYLFLGDYVDRGIYGLECICLLLSLKIRYPSKIFLLRGNHESERLNRSYGFREEIKNKYLSTKIWKAMLKTFEFMPICATIDNSIFCCHGGLSPLLFNSNVFSLPDIINSINRPCDVLLEGLLCDILWSDPTDVTNDEDIPIGWIINERGCSWTFGYDIVEEFLKKFDLDLIVRAHQVVEDGYEFFCNKKLITLFSAPNYCGKFDNAGAVLCLNKNLDTPEGVPPTVEGSFIIIQPSLNYQEQWKDLHKYD